MTWRASPAAALAYLLALPVLWVSAIFDGAIFAVWAATSAQSPPWWFLAFGVPPFVISLGAGGAGFGIDSSTWIRSLLDGGQSGDRG